MSRRATLPRDLLAGLTVGVSQVGNTMAYTILAGVPPVHGLYAAMIGTPAGALTAGSERMTIVPTAALCLTAGGALAALPAEQRVAGLLVLTVMTGVFMLVAGLLRAGSLLRFIEDAVMVGFMTGVSVQIVLGQLTAVSGIESAYTNKVESAADVFVRIGSADVTTVLVAFLTVMLIVVLVRSRIKLLAMAVALTVVTAIAAVLDLSVAVVGDIAPIPRAFPAPHLPDVSLVPRLLLPAASLMIVGLVQGAGIRSWIPNLDGSLGATSRDFVGQGAANIAGGFFGGAIMGGSLNATALNVSAGSRTRWSSFFAGITVIVIVLVAAPLVQAVPLAVTAGILIVAAFGMVPARAIRQIWRADRGAALLMAVTFVLVLAVPLQYAVLAGAALSALRFVYLSSLNAKVVQVTIDDHGRPRETSCPATLSDDSVTVVHIYGTLFFGAGPRVEQSLPAVGGARRAVVVLRLRGRETLQSSIITLVRDYAAELAAGGGRLYLAGIGPRMEEQLARAGLLDLLGPDAVVPASEELYGSCEIAQRRGQAWLRAQADERPAGPGAPGDAAARGDAPPQPSRGRRGGKGRRAR
jgi:SulP family sulfate permease